MTATTPQDREFIIIGQDEGSGYSLWDVIPAPADTVVRDEVSEEIEDAADGAFGHMDFVWGASAREAVEAFVAELRERSGLDDYALTADSRTERIEAADAVRAHGASSGGIVEILATVTPGAADTFSVDGEHPEDSGLISRRIRSSITESRLTFPAGEVIASIGPNRNAAGTLDLAVACAVLAADGQIDRYALGGIVCIAEMSWDGFLVPLYGVQRAVRAAYENGFRTVLVPGIQVADISARDYEGLTILGAHHLSTAVSAVNQHANERRTQASA